MLAERGRPEDLDRLAASGHVFDLKIDGIRALVRTQASGQEATVTMTSRNGLDLTQRFPELVESLHRLGDDVVLDAEVAVPDATGLPSWPLTQRRTAQRTAPGRLAVELPAYLYVFDVIEARGESTMSVPFRSRRQLLERWAAAWRGRLGLTVCSPDPWYLWQLVMEHSLEGIVAKRADSRYRPGRSRDWVKIKAVRTVSCLVGGVDWSGAEGTGEPRSLELFLVDEGGQLVPVGNASAGVSPPMRRQLLTGLRHPPLVVEVEYSDVTNAGVLRQPVVRAVRTDVDVLACGVDQLRRPVP
jgi:bifunctional non-homologous end joining protein LigD